MTTGVRPLTAFQLGVETVAGTAVATTRELYPDYTGMFDPGFVVGFHEGAQRGTFSNITHATLLNNAPTISYRSEPSHGITFDELIIIGSQLIAGQTGSGTTADKTWAFDSTEIAHTFDTYTLNVSDGNQGWELDYGFMTGFSLSGGFDDLTQCTMDWVGRTAVKATIDVVAANNAVKIPSALWTLKYASAQSGLTAAGALGNTLRGWTLTVDLPQRPRFYGDGAKEFGQGVAAMNLGGTLQMTWDAENDAVAQYDLWAAQTTSFIRLAAAGPTLGGGTYLATIDVAVIWESVQPLASESDGVNEYSMTGRIKYDSTWANSLTLDVVNSVATLA